MMWQNFLDGTLLLKSAGTWDESAHPRYRAGAPDGKGGEFAPKNMDAGAITSSQFPPPDVSTLHGGVLFRVHKGTDPANIEKVKELYELIPDVFVRDLKAVTLRADWQEKGAQALVFKTLGIYNSDTNALRLFGMGTEKTRRDIAHTLNHEIGHNLFDRARERSKAERDIAASVKTIDPDGKYTDEELVRLELGKPDAIPHLEALAQAARVKYPVFAARQKFTNAHKKRDGVSGYSASYNGKPGDIAANETFAELTRFYLQDKHDIVYGSAGGKKPLWRFFESTHPQYEKRDVAQAYLDYVDAMREYDKGTLAKSLRGGRAPIKQFAAHNVKFFDADGNEVPAARAVMAMEHTANGEAIYFVDGYADGK